MPDRLVLGLLLALEYRSFTWERDREEKQEAGATVVAAHSLSMTLKPGPAVSIRARQPGRR